MDFLLLDHIKIRKNNCIVYLAIWIVFLCLYLRLNFLQSMQLTFMDFGRGVMRKFITMTVTHNRSSKVNQRAHCN